MQRLVDAGLFGSGLVTLDTPEMVGRYNECLEQMGRPPTGLERFGVDGRGWSPEVAEEQGDEHYLTLEPPNQMAIIVTPDQRDKPIYFPFRSFDRLLMSEYFRRYGRAVADVTTTHGIWLDIDLGLSHYQSPEDLLLVRQVTVRSNALGLRQAALRQQALVRQFTDTPEGWFSEPLREKILVSARAHGDLRKRHVDLPELRFRSPAAFHSRAFGGVFVFRSAPERDGILAVEDGTRLERIDGERTEAYAIDDTRLLDRLYEKGFIEIDLGRYRRDPAALREKLEYLVVELLCRDDPELDLGSLSSARRKQRLLALKDRAAPMLFELERLVHGFQHGGGKDPGALSTELQRYLLHPAGGLDDAREAVVRQLLCRIQPQDPLNLYYYDKRRFYQVYRDWPRSKRDWVVGLLRARNGSGS